MIRLIWVLLLGFADIAAAHAVPLGKPADALASVLAPHRAVYEISLADRKEGVAVADVVGRMVFELTGSPCEGYTQNIRMVTRIADEEGKETYSDLRSSTWENGSGDRFRFTSSTYVNDSLQEIVSGSALRNRKNATVGIRLKRPAEAQLTVEGEPLFPTQHSIAIIRSAQSGERILRTKVYDGSEQGQIVYHTVTFIGNMRAGMALPADQPASGAEAADAAGGLEKMVSWPVAISYFDQTTKGDVTPSYELSFRLYPNGVSRNLLINYGEFSVRGRLDKLTYLHPAACK
jgi:hypothetical protein